MQNKLTHIDREGSAQMVDVTEKRVTERIALAEAWVGMSHATLSAITAGEVVKGHVLSVARIAGIQAAKRTSELIPLCHPLMLTSIKVEFESLSAGCSETPLPIDAEAAVRILTSCKLAGKTGVEMEALTAASVAALTIYDMCKALEKSMVIGPIRLLRKVGGKSGDWNLE